MKNNKTLHFIAVLLAAAVLFWLTSLPRLAKQKKLDSPPEVTSSQPQKSQETENFGPYDVIRVIDGDTLLVSVDGAETRIRLIGVDTPESVHPDESKNTEAGELASAFVTALLDGEKVYLEYDIDREDDYGRTLAYVYLDDGITMLNRLLLEEGYATLMTIQPNSKYADAFYELQEAAREAGRGFWAAS